MIGHLGATAQGAPAGRRPSRQLLEWIGLGALLAGLAGYVAYDLRSSRRAIEDAERDRLEHQAGVVEKLLGTRLQATARAVDALRADLPGFLAQADGIARLNERMQVMVASMVGVRTFLLVDVRGIAVASNRKELIGTDFHEGERYHAIRSHPAAATLYVSPPFMTPLGNWALSLGRAVLTPSDAFDGYLLAILDPGYFELLLDSVRYAPDMSTAMIHGRGKIIYRLPDQKGAIGMDLSERPDSAFNSHLRSGRSLSSWTAQLSTTGAEALMVLQTIQPASGPADAVLVASLSRETAALFAPWRKELADRVAVTILLGAAALLGLRFSQRQRADRRRQEEARTALQAQAAESQKLESIGRLAGGVAHDFNNLLTVILGLGDEARKDAKLGRPIEPEDLEQIMAAAERAADLTRQLLAFARKQIIAPVTLDVNEQLRSSQKLLGRVIGEDIRIAAHLESRLWPVRCDPGLFGQIVLNLAVNARDAMPGGGTLTLTTENVVVAPGDAVPDPALTPGDYVRLQVEDTGTGMPPEVQAHLFEPFFTTKGPGKGTGLGLSTVYGIVKQSGAHITVRSSSGVGTAFEVFFPRQSGEVAPPARAAALTEGGHETILLVEDEPGVRTAVAEGLRAGGYRVLSASCADEAEALADAERDAVHLLLTDVVLPGRRGPDLAHLVRSRCPGVRVLYMSGHPQGAFGPQGVLEEGVDFIAKPFTAESLRARVRAALNQVAQPPRA